MAGSESRRKLAEWRIMQHRGRNKIQKATKDPVARTKLLSEIPSPKQAILHLSEADRRSALASVPAILSENPVVDTEGDQISNKPPHSFLTSSPAEIRNLIYHYTVGYPTCRKLYDYYYDQKEKARAKIELRPRSANTRVSRHSKIHLQTPTILLLCRQITREALSMLHCQSFNIDRIPPWVMGNPMPLPITNFISRPTLQTLRFAEIKISLGESTDFGSGKVWLGLLDDVLNAWSQHNCLVRLHVVFKLYNVTRQNIWFYELEDYEKLVEKVSTCLSSYSRSGYNL